MLREHSSPWLLLRTFSKAYGLAGLRVGYAVASDGSLLGLMDRVRTPFNVNRLAQAAAVAALKDMAHSQDCVARTIQERERIRRALGGLGIARRRRGPTSLLRRPGGLVGTRRSAFVARSYRQTLARAGILRSIRVSIGSPRANDQFLTALGAVANYQNEPRFRTSARRVISIHSEHN